MTDHETLGLPPISRRRFVQGSALAGFGAFLAACGTSGTGTATPSPATSQPPGTTPPVDQTPSPVLNFANWPLYIDTDDDDNTKHKTLEDFTAEFGTVVDYREVINANEEFFGTIKAPLEAGQDTGWDLIVPTQWMAARLVRLGWVERFDLANMPTFVANLEDAYRSPDFDPTNEYHAVWQAGMTGLGYDAAVTGDLDTLAALWDSRWAGRITYLNEMRDAVGLTLAKLGYDSSTVTAAQFDEAIAEMKRAVDDRIVRAFMGNDYAEELVAGNVVLAMAWSGDIIQKQLERETLRFTIPPDGGNLWYDCLMIPKGAANKYTAELFIDFYYRPEIAAQVEAWVNYICPVKGAREELFKIDEELAQNDLIFPSAETLSRVRSFRSLDEDEETYFNDQFSTLIGV
jgi:spermidine/putrescine transport system substrate-binding protein